MTKKTMVGGISNTYMYLTVNAIFGYIIIP